MRQLKTFMRNRKKEMLACGPCECRTLQCWRYANENCGCGENGNNRFFAFNGEGENKTFFFFNMNPDEDNTVNIEVDPDTEVGDSKVVIGDFGAIKNEEARALWIEMWESLDVECVKTLLGGREEIPSGSWRFKAEAIAQFNALMNNPTEKQMNILKERLEHQCGDDEQSPIIEKVSDDCIIHFSSLSGVYNPKTQTGGQVNSDYVNLSKKMVSVPVGTLMKVEYADNDNDVSYVFYDENNNEIDRVFSRALFGDSKYRYYVEDFIPENFLERDSARDGYIIKSSMEIFSFGTAEVLMQVTMVVEPEGWGTTNLKKIGVPYHSERTTMTTVQGTGYFKITHNDKEFIISASPDTSIKDNSFGGWKVNGERPQPNHGQIEDDMAITATFTASPR